MSLENYNLRGVKLCFTPRGILNLNSLVWHQIWMMFLVEKFLHSLSVQEVVSISDLESVSSENGRENGCQP